MRYKNPETFSKYLPKREERKTVNAPQPRTFICVFVFCLESSAYFHGEKIERERETVLSIMAFVHAWMCLCLN